MPSHRFYYLNELDHNADADWAACASDAAAINRAATMLPRVRHCRRVEVWEVRRRGAAEASAAS